MKETTLQPTETSGNPEHQLQTAKSQLPILRAIGYPWIILILAIPAVAPTWFSSTPASDQVNSDALIGIASVAAIVWTGGLIAFQVRQLASELTASLWLLRFAFLAPLIALVASAPVLRFVAMLLAFYTFRESLSTSFGLLILQLLKYAISNKA